MTLQLSLTWERHASLILLQNLYQRSYQSLLYDTLDNVDLLDLERTLKTVRDRPTAVSISLTKLRRKRINVLAGELDIPMNSLARLAVAHLLLNAPHQYSKGGHDVEEFYQD